MGSKTRRQKGRGITCSRISISEPPEVRARDAAICGNMRELKALLDGGFDVNKVVRTNHYDMSSPSATLLSYAVMFLQLEAAEELLKRGANPNLENYRQALPLMYASNYGDKGGLAMVKLLLRYGADPNAGSTGVTPTAHAFTINIHERNSDNIVRELINHGGILPTYKPGIPEDIEIKSRLVLLKRKMAEQKAAIEAEAQAVPVVGGTRRKTRKPKRKTRK